MILYAVLFLVLLWCVMWELDLTTVTCFPPVLSKPYVKRIWNALPVFMIFLFGIFRDTTVGHDAQSYYVDYWCMRDYYSWIKLATDFTMDNGFFAILKIIGLFTSDYWVARAVLFTITFAIYYAVMREETPHTALSIIVFLGLAHLGLMYGILRQALAGSICFLSYTQIKKGAWKKCAVLILVGITIHKSSIICALMLLLYYLETKVKMKKCSGLQLLFLSVIVGIGAFVVIPIITSLYSGGSYADIAVPDGGYGMLLFMIAIFMLLTCLMHKTNTKEDSELAFLYNLSCGALLLQVGALQWSLLNRVTVYFSIYWCLLFPKLICKLPKRQKLFFSLIVVVMFGFMFFYQLSDVEMFVMHQF